MQLFKAHALVMFSWECAYAPFCYAEMFQFSLHTMSKTTGNSEYLMVVDI